MKTIMAVAAFAAAQLCTSAAAHDLTADECNEGAEFIMHAAMSRDSGLSRTEFVSRMQEDLLAIRAFPPELRWFVQDESDEALLVAQAEQVFDDPREPDLHQRQFLQACFERVGPQQGSTAGAEANADVESQQ